MLTLLNSVYYNFLSPGASGSIQTLDLSIMSHVFYRIVSRAHPWLIKDFFHFSLLMTVLGFEPLVFGL